MNGLSLSGDGYLTLQLAMTYKPVTLGNTGPLSREI